MFDKITIDRSLLRGKEIYNMVGDNAKERLELWWVPETSLETINKEMVDFKLEKEKVLIKE